MNQTVIVSEEWLKACGLLRFAGQPFKVIRIDERASYSPMGTCYYVERPDGQQWVVFHCRLDVAAMMATYQS